jgi:hypothetical protein
METPKDDQLTLLMNKKGELSKLVEEAKIKNNFEEFLRYKKELNNLYYKTYHLKNKDKEEYKQKKISNYKKYLENPDNYEKHKSKQKEYYRRIMEL